MANAYLNTFDDYVANSWENKKTRHQYAFANSRFRALRNQGTLKPAYLVRYCDDWVIITNTKRNAEKWKCHLQQRLKDHLKLTLSEEKTKITCVKKKPITFLGFTYKVVPSGNARKGYITKIHPHPERLENKVAEIRKEIKKIHKQPNRELVFDQILKVNAMTRGIINYYQAATHVYMDLHKHAWSIFSVASGIIKKLGGRLVPANQVNNLYDVHQQYTKRIPAIQDGNRLIGNYIP